MPALNFNSRFAPLVANGSKTQTVRKARKRPIRAGDTVHLFQVQRTKKCLRLGEGRVSAVFPVSIATGLVVDGDPVFLPNIFARNDGFSCFADMREWFKVRYGLPFNGVVICWFPLWLIECPPEEILSKTRRGRAIQRGEKGVEGE